MRKILQTISWLSLAALVLPAILFLSGDMTLEALKTTMLIATVVWFGATPFWMGTR